LYDALKLSNTGMFAKGLDVDDEFNASESNPKQCVHF